MTDNGPKNSDRFIILLEDMGSKVDLLAESMTQTRVVLSDKIDTTKQELNVKMDVLGLAVRKNAEAIMGVGHHLDGVDHRLDGIDHRLDGVDQRLDRMEIKMDRVVDKVDQHDQDIHKLKDQAALG